jgi:hypothetical protein
MRWRKPLDGQAAAQSRGSAHAVHLLVPKLHLGMPLYLGIWKLRFPIWSRADGVILHQETVKRGV